MKNRLILSTAFTLAVFTVSVNAQTVYLDYSFNGSGNSVTNNGTTADMDLVYYNSNSSTAGNTVDLYGAAGSGVSGLAGDLAFDNTASTGNGGGSGYYGGRAQSSTTDAVGVLTSFTMMGWLKSDATAGTATLMDSYDSASNSGVTLFWTGTGGLSLRVGDGTTTTYAGSSSNPYGSGGEWVFFALTYDGTTTSNNVTFYVGADDTATSSNISRSITLSSVNMDDVRAIALGNGSGGRASPFDGLMDNFRLVGATSGSDGALSLSAIESYRVSAIPEPSQSVALLGVACLCMTLARRRIK